MFLGLFDGLVYWDAQFETNMICAIKNGICLYGYQGWIMLTKLDLKYHIYSTKTIQLQMVTKRNVLSFSSDFVVLQGTD